MFTQETVLNIAIEAEAQYNALKGNTADFKSRHDAFRKKYEAETVLKYMIAKNIDNVESIGPFHRELPAVGAQVKIKAGSVIGSTSDKNRRVSARANLVTVSHAYAGYIIDGDVYGPTVHWAGSGGYWCWTSLDNVEF